VRKLRDATARHLEGHRFYCFSDVDVPCERIALEHDWPGWWAKIELFRAIKRPTLYLDLDTLVTGPLQPLARLTHDFAMIDLRHANQEGIGQSGVMWITKPMPEIYDKFTSRPEAWMRIYTEQAKQTYCGDQAFIYDAIGIPPKITRDLPGFVRSYKLQCVNGPLNSSLVCFHGKPGPHETTGWTQKAWI